MDEDALKALERREQEARTRQARLYGKIEEMDRHIAKAEETMRELGIPDLETAKDIASKLLVKAEEFRAKAEEALDEAENVE